MTIDASVVARVLGITSEYSDLRGGTALFLPQRVAVFAQGRSNVAYALTKFTATSAGMVGARMGYGSPAHLILRELMPENGDGVGAVPVTVYPLADDYDDVHATGTITPSGTQAKAASYRFRVGGVKGQPFTIPAGASVAARCALIAQSLNAVLHMPVVAADNTTSVGLTSKWAGLTANAIKVELIEDGGQGTVFALSNSGQLAGGVSNPAVDTALAQVGDVWETMLLNSLTHDDTTALDAFQTWGEGRWGELTHKPAVVFRGNTDATYSAATAVTATRKDDRVNCQLVAPGSPSLPFVVAARQLARIARLANNNPPHDYGSQRATGLIPGADGDQWNHTVRDLAVKAGSSTIEVKDGVINVSDVVTSWSPDEEVPPAYRHVVQIVRAQQVVFNMQLAFGTPEYDGAPLINDDQATVNASAKKPKMIIQRANNVLQALGDQAILSDVASAKKRTTCTIDPGNPNRWNLVVYPQHSGNSNIRDVGIKWSFYFGSAA